MSLGDHFLSAVRTPGSGLFIQKLCVNLRRGVFQISHDSLFCLCKCLYVTPNLSSLFQSSTIQFDVETTWGQCLQMFYPSILTIILFNVFVFRFFDGEICISVEIVTVGIEIYLLLCLSLSKVKWLSELLFLAAYAFQ